MKKKINLLILSIGLISILINGYQFFLMKNITNQLNLFKMNSGQLEIKLRAQAESAAQSIAICELRVKHYEKQAR